MATTETIEDRKADDRGRVRLGPEYAGREVDVVVIADDESDDEQRAN